MSPAPFRCCPSPIGAERQTGYPGARMVGRVWRTCGRAHTAERAHSRTIGPGGRHRSGPPWRGPPGRRTVAAWRRGAAPRGPEAPLRAGSSPPLVCSSPLSAVLTCGAPAPAALLAPARCKGEQAAEGGSSSDCRHSAPRSTKVGGGGGQERCCTSWHSSPGGAGRRSAPPTCLPPRRRRRSGGGGCCRGNPPASRPQGCGGTPFLDAPRRRQPIFGVTACANSAARRC